MRTAFSSLVLSMSMSSIALATGPKDDKTDLNQEQIQEQAQDQKQDQSLVNSPITTLSQSIERHRVSAVFGMGNVGDAGDPTASCYYPSKRGRSFPLFGQTAKYELDEDCVAREEARLTLERERISLEREKLALERMKLELRLQESVSK